MLYCGYQGIGKTSYCKAHPNCIDLDSSNYEKTPDWVKNYITDAIRYEKQGKTVFVSAHPHVILYLQKIKHKFTLIIPENNKKIWELRLSLRYEITKELYALKALNDFKDNFERDMNFYNSLKCKKITIKAVRVLTSLEEELK